MVNGKLKISGEIINNDAKYLFILTDFVLDIKLINCNDQFSGVQFYPKYIKSENGFIKGITDNNECIYLAIGNKDIGINSFRSITIDFYIKFNQGYNFDKEVDAIKFIGGTLNQFAKLNILGIPTKEDSYLKVPYKNENVMKIDINNNIINGSFIFRGSARSNWSVEDGISVFEDDASLYIDTVVTQKNIIKIFRYVSNIFKFFTFRNNVGGFDIVLMIKDEKNKYINIGKCYYKNEEYYKSNKSATDCISIKLFNQDQLKTLFDLLYIDEDIEDKSSKVFSYDFLNDDEHSTLISKNNVKDTITAFECIERMIVYKYDNDIKFDAIKEKIVAMIDSDNECNLLLEEKNSCKKYIRNMGKKNKSIKDRIVIQYNNYKEYLELFVERNGIKIDDLSKQIEELVKYRHKHTHNDIGVLTQELANTTYIVQALIYCMVLKKVDINDDNIKYVLLNCIC